MTAKPPPPTPPLTLGILGLGRWGHRLAAAFARTEQSRILWHCDPDPARLAAAELPAGARRTPRHEDVLADPAVQAVVIATPPATHAPLALEALAAGKHVFVEKPMTTSLASAEELVAAVERTGLTLMVGHILTFHPGHIELRRLVREGAIGRVHTVACQRWSPRLGRPADDAWWSLAVHDMSVLGQLLEGEAESVEVSGERAPGSTCYGRVRGELLYAGGVRAQLEASTVDEVKLRRILVAGERGTLVFDEQDAERGIALYDLPRAPFDCGVASAFAMLDDARLRDRHVAPQAEPLALELRHFVDSMLAGTAPRCNAREGLHTIRALEPGTRSLRSPTRSDPETAPRIAAVQPVH